MPGNRGRQKDQKVSLSIKQREIQEEKQAMKDYGSSDSGASLGDILGAAISKAAQERESSDGDSEAEAEAPAEEAVEDSPTESEAVAAEATEAETPEAEAAEPEATAPEAPEAPEDAPEEVSGGCRRRGRKERLTAGHRGT